MLKLILNGVEYCKLSVITMIITTVKYRHIPTIHFVSYGYEMI